jgi:hypothetical protein
MCIFFQIKIEIINSHTNSVHTYVYGRSKYSVSFLDDGFL